MVCSLVFARGLSRMAELSSCGLEERMGKERRTRQALQRINSAIAIICKPYK